MSETTGLYAFADDGPCRNERFEVRGERLYVPLIDPMFVTDAPPAGPVAKTKRRVAVYHLERGENFLGDEYFWRFDCIEER